MESMQDVRGPVEADPVPPVPGELVVQNGRLSGARHPLNAPLTLFGRAPGCDVRLDVTGVSPVHCVVACGPTGLVLRDLHSEAGTLVNGKPASLTPLREGDLLTVGPFSFKVRVAPIPPPPEAQALEGEREAVRIQAAAVAAQQAALTELEMRLQHRRVALEQQEKQLANHLEEKRKQLVALRDQARQARADLQKERADYEKRVVESTRDLANARREAADSQREAQAERRRLQDLRRRLKQRWHRHWVAERATMRRQQEELAGQRRVLEKDAERLQQERAAVHQARMRFNGEAELSKRQLQEAWTELGRQQQQWQEQRAEGEVQARRVEQRETALGEAERRLAGQQQQGEERRMALELEAEGLENRIANQRRKLSGQEEELARLDAFLRERKAREVPGGTSAAAFVPEPALLPGALVVRSGAREGQLCETEERLRMGLGALEQVAGELADQRLHLAEQCQRLLEAQVEWQQQRDATAADLEATGLRLQEQERAHAGREVTLDAVAWELRQRQEEASHLRRHLEAWQARLTMRAADWETERERLLVEMQAREALAERRLAQLGEIRRRWHRRRLQQQERLRVEWAACAGQRLEYAALLEEWLKRQRTWEQEQKELVEGSLSLSSDPCEGPTLADNPEVGHLEQVRQRWSAQIAVAHRALAREREAVRGEMTALAGHQREVAEAVAQATRQEAEYTRRQAAWEEQQLGEEQERARLRREMEVLRVQRQKDERHLKELHDELERVLRVLLNESGSESLPMAQAA